MTLDGSKSYDPNKNKITYKWTQLAGPSVSLSDSNSPNPKFTAPTINSPTSLKFQLVVNNGQDDSKPSTVTVNVQPLTPVPQPIPVADAGKPQTVNSGSVVTLDGSKSYDPNKNKITYQWTQLAGPSVFLSDSTSPNPKFTAPTVNSQTSLKFQLVVNNGQDNSKPSTVTVNVQPINGIPSIFTLSYNDGNFASAKDITYIINFEMNNKNIKIVHVNEGSFDSYRVLNDSAVEFHTNEIIKGSSKTAIVAIDYGDVQNFDIKGIEGKNIDLLIHTKTTINGITKDSSIDPFINILSIVSKITGLSNNNFDLANQIYNYTTPCLNLTLNNTQDNRQYSLVLENCGDVLAHMIVSAYPKSSNPSFSSSLSSTSEYDIDAKGISYDNIIVGNPSDISSKKPLAVVGSVILNILGNYYDVGKSIAWVP